MKLRVLLNRLLGLSSRLLKHDKSFSDVLTEYVMNV